MLLLEELFSNPLGAAYSVLFSLLVVPIWPKLSNITAVLAEANTIAQDEDEFAVPGLIGNSPRLPPKRTRSKAFALGWLCHLAGSVTAEPFVNNIVGGPYRTHWWRNRLAQNFIDSWVFGFAETPGQMTGDEPTPAYEA